MKILLTGAFSYAEEQIEYIKALGFETVFVQDERQPIEFDVSDIDAVVCNGLFLYNDIERFKSLKFIQLLSAGLDRVPLDYINSHNIKLCNARGVYSVPMAEFALCGILQLYKQTRFFIENQNEHKWDKHRGLLELSGKSALIIGAGSVGCEVAKRLKAFDVITVGVDLYPAENDCFDEVLPMSALDEELEKADIVVLTLPLTDNNKGFFDRNKFGIMKNNSVFVNIARGGLVVESDLTDFLKSDVPLGAVLDVFEEEPLDSASPLWNIKNVVLTPHNSFVGENNSKRMFDTLKKNLEEF